MNFEITVTSRFEKHLKALAKRYKSIKDDYKSFIESIKENPFQGDELSPGIRKIRMAITSKGRGKSGGARVITYTVIAAERSGDVYLLEIYDKSDYSTVDISVIKSMVDEL
jgi:mRNA-degrading endonuclease RelE of RelBE toxin-antitoxin system